MTAESVVQRTPWWSRPPRTGRHAAPAAEASRRVNPVVPLVLASTLAVTANLTGAVQPAEAAPAKPKPRPLDRPVAVDRGKTVREAFEDAKRAARTAATALRSTLKPPTTYTVQEGDTLLSVVERYDLKLATVLALNGLSWRTSLVPGQVIKLTATGPAAPAKPKTEAVPKDQRHTVAAGETLSGIAEHYGIEVAWVLSANGFSSGSIIYPGQSIVIPDGAPKTPAKPVATATPAPATPSAQQPAASAPSTSPASVTIPGSTPSPIQPADGVVVPLNEPQTENARLIIKVARQLGVPDYGIVIALAAAAQESGLRNLAEGDRDSVGLFQQRPSQGWGTPAQLNDRGTAIRLFFGGPSNPNAGVTNGLLDLPGWQSMPLTVAAQKVQGSAYPTAYAKWETSARAWLKDLG